MDGGSTTDAELLHDRRTPDESFAVFYRRHVASVQRYVRARGVDAHTAADIVANTFFRALRYRYRYRLQGDSALPWLVTIAARCATDAARSRARHDRIARRVTALNVRELTASDLDGYAQDPPATPELDEALTALGDPIRHAVLRRVVDGVSYSTIALEADVSEPTARQRVSRGLRSLRAAINPSQKEQ